MGKLHHGGAKDWVSTVKSLPTSSSHRWLPHRQTWLRKAKCRSECMHITECVILLQGTNGLLVLSWLTQLNYRFSTHLPALVEAGAPESLRLTCLPGFWYAQTSFWFGKKNHFRIVFSFIIFHISDLKNVKFETLCLVLFVHWSQFLYFWDDLIQAKRLDFRIILYH